MYWIKHCKFDGNWHHKTFETADAFFKYCESLQPTIIRPDLIIVNAITSTEMEIMKSLLYKPLIFMLKDQKLYGGSKFYRRFFCRATISPQLFGCQVVDGGMQY